VLSLKVPRAAKHCCLKQEKGSSDGMHLISRFGGADDSGRAELFGAQPINPLIKIIPIRQYIEDPFLN
jgi:hypothetical protein